MSSHPKQLQTPEEDQAFLASLTGLQFLIADPTSSRKTFRTLFSLFKIPTHLVDVADKAEYGLEYMKKRKPNVIIADISMGIEVCFEMVRLQKELVPDSDRRLFFLSTSQDSNQFVATAADESIDVVLVKPFTFAMIKQKVAESLFEKLCPSPFTQAINRGKALLNEGKCEEALVEFNEARFLDASLATPMAWMGETYWKLKRIPEAQSAFEEGLSVEGTHFRCLMGMIDCLMQVEDYARAYQYGKTLMNEHTVPVQRLPKLIRLSIMNQQYDDVLQFFETTSSLEHVDNVISGNISAGLVVCGIHFLRKGDIQSALNAFRKAEVAARGDARILTRIFVALIEAGQEAETRGFMSRLPESVRESNEIQLAYLEYWVKTEPPMRVLEVAMKMLKEKRKSERVYEVAIRCSKQLGRSESQIQNLVDEAGYAFPEKKAWFAELAQSL